MALVPMGWLSESQSRHKGQGTCGRRTDKAGKVYHGLIADVWDNLPGSWSALVDLFPVVHLALHYQSNLGERDLQQEVLLRDRQERGYSTQAPLPPLR